MAGLHREGPAREPLSGAPETLHGDSRLPLALRHPGATKADAGPAPTSAPFSPRWSGVDGGPWSIRESWSTRDAWSSARDRHTNVPRPATRRGSGARAASGPRGRARPRPDGRGAPKPRAPRQGREWPRLISLRLLYESGHRPPISSRGRRSALPPVSLRRERWRRCRRERHRTRSASPPRRPASAIRRSRPIGRSRSA